LSLSKFACRCRPLPLSPPESPVGVVMSPQTTGQDHKNTPSIVLCADALDDDAVLQRSNLHGSRLRDGFVRLGAPALPPGGRQLLLQWLTDHATGLPTTTKRGYLASALTGAALLVVCGGVG
jgi:hypothetical protein